MRLNLVLGTILFLTSFAIHAQDTYVSFATAKEAAVSWMAAKGHTRTVDTARCYTNLDVDSLDGKEVNFYVIQFNEGGYTIVPATKLVIPVLAYNHLYAYEKELLRDGALYFLDSYDKAIAIHKKEPSEMPGSILQWDNLLTSGSISCSGSSSPHPSLLEHYQTSRWAGWSRMYDCVDSMNNQITPSPSNAEIGGNCVPTGLSQICRYYRHPFVGTGSGSHTMTNSTSYNPSYAAGQTNYSDFSKQAFDYDLMPYRVQNQGPADGLPQDGPNSWDHLYPICSDELNEIGYLNWNLGVAARMNWYSGGTYGTPSNWANDLVDHFGYTWNPSTGYVTSTSVSNYKNALRNSIDNERPVLCSGSNNRSGHFFLYSGYDCDNYFYGNMGWGGNSDGFHYIFTADASGNYSASPYPISQVAATNVHPLCDYPANLHVPGVTYTSGSVHVKQALVDLTVSSASSPVIVDNGSESFMIGGNSVELLPGMEVVLGGKLHVLIETCDGPEMKN